MIEKITPSKKIHSLEDARKGVCDRGRYNPIVLLFDAADDLLEEVNLAEDPDS